MQNELRRLLNTAVFEKGLHDIERVIRWVLLFALSDMTAKQIRDDNNLHSFINPLPFCFQSLLFAYHVPDTDRLWVYQVN